MEYNWSAVDRRALAGTKWMWLRGVMVMYEKTCGSMKMTIYWQSMKKLVSMGNTGFSRKFNQKSLDLDLDL